jgi:two-component system, cell cycle sensor histidine kinase and response regulator CckA
MRTAEILGAASLALTRTLDLDAVLQTLLDCLAQLVPYDSANVMLVEGGARLSLRALRGYERWADPARPPVIAFDAGTNLILDAILTSHQSVLIPDTRQHVGWERVAGAEHVLCWLGVPLSDGGSVVGLYSLNKAEAGFFTEEHRGLAESLAPHAALAIRNARLYARERAAREESERLQAATRALSASLDPEQVFALILSELRALIPYDSASVMELKDERMEIVGGHGFANLADHLGLSFDVTADNPNREVVRSRAPVLLEDAPTRYPVFRSGPHAATLIRSWLGVPLLFGDRLIGMVALDKAQRGFFTAEHARLAESFAAQAAIALENARLYASARRELGERRRAEAKYHAFVEQAPYGVVAVDRDQRIVLVNAEAERLFGYGRAEILGQPVERLMPQRFREKHRGHADGIMADPGLRPLGTALELHGIRKDGTAFPIDVSFGPLETEEGSLVMAAVRDATDRKQAEEALRHSRDLLDLTEQMAKVGGWELDVEGQILTWSKEVYRIHGVDPANPPSVDQAIHFYAPEARPVITTAMQAGIDSGTPFDLELPLITAQGQHLWVRAQGAAERRGGRTVRLYGAFQDITERRRVAQMLRQSQNVEAIGQLAGGVAHDFNNILGVILGYGELAQRQLGAEHPAGARVDQMVKAAERAAGLTRQLLAFSRKQVMQPKRLDLNALVANVEKMLGRLIGEDIDVVVRPAPSLGTVKADPGQIEQVILNLAVNARDAMPKGGSLTLETASVQLDEGYAAAHPPLQPGRYVMLAVSDTGIGMNEETQQRIFEPFFTTKPEGQGTGLGLSTVYGIVKQSGGYIWVYSEPGRGTTFKVYLPRVDEPAEAAPAGAAPAEAPRGHETILLVEDTATLQEVIRETLEESGYTVLLASNGEEALALAREREGPIHLLLTDVVMPKLGGGDLAKLLLALRPEIRVLYMSGYTSGAISHHGVLGEGVMLLEKPFTGDKLARVVREALDRPRST